MSVYFAQVGRYVKIGYSANPERRVRNLFKSATRYGRPQDIATNAPRRLLGSVPGHLNEERTAHEALSDFRVLGEWFLDEPGVRDYIATSVAAGRVAPTYVERSAGPYWWGDDPVLAPSPEEQRAAADAISAVFAQMPSRLRSTA